MSGQVSEREPNYGAMTTLHIRRKDGDIVLRMDVDDTKHPNFRLILEPDHYEAVVPEAVPELVVPFQVDDSGAQTILMIDRRVGSHGITVRSTMWRPTLRR